MLQQMATEPLDWDDLRYFLAAMENRTLAGAARQLGVEHTTIGRRLTSLERSLGAALVTRGPEGLELTELGRKLAPLVGEVERCVRAVCERVSAEKRRVRLAVPSGFFAQILSAALPELKQQSPALALEILSGSRPVDLKKGEADLALRVGPIRDKELVVRKLGEAGWALYASTSYLAQRSPLQSPDDLSGHELIGYDSSLVTTEAGQWLERRASGASIALRSREMVDMLAAAVNGAGLAVLPCSLGDAEPGLERLTPETVARQPLSLVYRREARVSEETIAVVHFVTRVIRVHADRLRGRSSRTSEISRAE